MSTTYADGYGQGFGFADRGAATRRAGAARRVRAMAKPLVSYYWRQRTIRELSRLEDYRLEDIGVARADIPTIAADRARAEASAWARRAAGANGFGG